MPEPQEHEYVHDSPDVVRDQILRGLLILVPARLMDVVVKEAMQRAVVHVRKIAEANAESQRRTLLATKAAYKHSKGQTAKVLDMYMSASSYILLLADQIHSSRSVFIIQGIDDPQGISSIISTTSHVAVSKYRRICLCKLSIIMETYLGKNMCSYLRCICLISSPSMGFQTLKWE